MPEVYVMTLGMECPVTGLQKFDAAKFKEFVQQVCGDLQLNIEFNDTDYSVFITFDKVDEVDNVIAKFLEMSAERNLEVVDFSFCPLIAVAGGDVALRNVHSATAQKVFDAIRTEIRGSDSPKVTSLVLITHEVFDNLDSRTQEFYGQVEQVSNSEIVVHRRYPADALQCFVISPIGEEGSEVRKRADVVFNNYIKRACDGTVYRPVRGDLLTGQEIMPEVNDALQTSPMVIAYLGGWEPRWNPNVMLEVGYRLATGLPIIFLLDSNPEGAEKITLPFDLKDYRQIYLPLLGVDENGMLPTITTIRRMLNEEWSSSWQLPIACATIVLNIGSISDGKPNRFVEASPEFEEFLEMGNIPGTKLEPVIKHLMSKMPEIQRQPFSKEQNYLISRLVSPDIFPDSSIKNVVAEIPIVFADHKKFRGRAFLPVIHSYAKYGEILKLRVFYLDVTEATQKTPDGYFSCKLSGNKLLD